MLEPVGYGMRFAAQFVGVTLLPLEFNPGDVNATAYAGERDGKTYLVVINKDATQPLSLPMPAYRVVSTLSGELESHEAAIVVGNSTGAGGTLEVPAHTGIMVEMAR